MLKKEFSDVFKGANPLGKVLINNFKYCKLLIF